MEIRRLSRNSKLGLVGLALLGVLGTGCREHETVRGEQTLDSVPKGAIRTLLGASFEASDAGLAVAAVLPGSAAEAAGLGQGDIVTRIDGSEVTAVGDLGAIGTFGGPKTYLLAISRDLEELQVEVDPGFYAFPEWSFSSGVEFNKFCDDRCNCTIDQSGFLCVTVWVYAGEGPDGGVLFRKVCGAQESGLPRIDSDCGVREYF